jgi:ribosomal protein L17
MKPETKAQKMARKIHDRISELIAEQDLKAKDLELQAFKMRSNNNHEEAARLYNELACAYSYRNGLYVSRMVSLLARLGK